MRRTGQLRPRQQANAVVAAAIIDNRLERQSDYKNYRFENVCLTFPSAIWDVSWKSAFLLCGPALVERTIAVIFKKLANSDGHH